MSVFKFNKKLREAVRLFLWPLYRGQAKKNVGRLRLQSHNYIEDLLLCLDVSTEVTTIMPYSSQHNIKCLVVGNACDFSASCLRFLLN